MARLFLERAGHSPFPREPHGKLCARAQKRGFACASVFLCPLPCHPERGRSAPFCHPERGRSPSRGGLIHTRENLGDPPCHPERSRGVLRVVLLLQLLFVLPNVGDTCAIRLRARFLRSLRSVGMTKRSSRKSRRDGACDFLRKKTTPRRIPPVTPSAVEESCALRFCYKVFLYCRM